MKASEIITALDAGDYRIEHAENCNCSFNWRIYGKNIEETVFGDECWEGNTLYVGNEPIAQDTLYEGREVLTDGITEDDIPDDIWDEMGISEMVERGESANNDTHESNRRDSLIDWLNELVKQGYRLMRDNDRGFANEFTSVLVSPDTDTDDNDWDERTAEQWADDYLYNGDAATDAYNSVMII